MEKTTEAIDDKSIHSSYYEKLVEHLFIADILKTAWTNGNIQIEVSRAEIDNSGYDLILECNKIIRHVQLKCSDIDSKTSVQKVNVKLAEKPSGCVIWIQRSFDIQQSDFLLKYRFFGATPGKPLPSLDDFRTAKHSKGNALGEKKLRVNIRMINKGQFVELNNTNELLNELFGLSI